MSLNLVTSEKGKQLHINDIKQILIVGVQLKLLKTHLIFFLTKILEIKILFTTN